METNTPYLEMKTIVENNLHKIKSFIDDELKKRCFPEVSEILVNVPNRMENMHVVLESEEFNTTPVIMKSIKIQNFGGSIWKDIDKIVDENDEIKKFEIVRAAIPVHVSYNHFDGGSNGCKLFSVSVKIYRGEHCEFEVR